jgi:prepilin-type N-terminal cleavage/methylation domain-containing protein
MRTRAAARREGGFTLIELLISVALMVLLLAAVTMIFAGTTETVYIQEARMTVFTNARYAIDIMENDLLGCLSFNPPQQTPPVGGAPQQPPPPSSMPVVYQAFWMENGVVAAPGQLPSYNVGGPPAVHTQRAGDRMSFRATTAVGDTMQTCQVTYELIPGSKTLDPNGTPVAGDSSHERTVRTNRGLYTLIRRVRVAKPDQPNIFSEFATVKDRVSGAMVKVEDQELCHYIISFNLEYYSNNQTFSQLDPSPFPSSDPLGDGDRNGGKNDTTTPYRVPAIRVTFVVVEDVGERQERTVQKILWIPQG